ncbi:NAD(P)/FAD-dependent oxidoreductase [Halalkalibacter flavus]|uniref:NAD(P)/FAD-dependent oxidoreductase n=1 Tax=Halalkalibacter flavus TaxID=3090668 RepID=UPI002FC8FE04
MIERGMVIVGAGEAGTRAALEMREQGWKGRITLLGEERQVPYERPPLSKECLTKEEQRSPVYLIDQEKITENEIDFVAGCEVIDIERVNQFVRLADGRQIPYEKLLLATGARPRKLMMEGSDLHELFYLRTFADAMKIRTELQTGKRITIIGGGFIGLEVAASAIKRGCTVTLVEVGSRILSRGVPEEIAKIVEARHREAGVTFTFGIGIEKIKKVKDGVVLSLADGTSIHSDVIIAGIGAIPETKLAETCGLEVENGICVNEFLRTSDPAIFAAGDCCSFPHPIYNGKRIRLEAWRNAQDQGIYVARAMLGTVVPFQVVPWFWSDQYDLCLQVTGLVDGGDKTIIRDLGSKGKLFFHLSSDNRLMAASGIGTPSIAKDIRIAEMLIEKQVKLQPKDLADPKVKLKGILKVLNV